MENSIITVSNVHAYLDKDGTAWLNVEDVARGLGFTQTKDCVEYVRWDRVNGYLREFGFSPQVGKDDFIPENMFYRLAMKAKNEVAEKFQVKVADEILPAIRKTGSYTAHKTTEELINNPQFIIEICQALITERAEKQELRDMVDMQAVQIAEMTPKVSYCDLVLQSKEALPVSIIAKDYGYSARNFNALLREMRIQYKLKSGAWLVYQDYAKEGYTCTKTFSLEDGRTTTHTYWTQKGRFFLYDELKKRGILPLIEQTNEEEEDEKAIRCGA